jgi:hypothetical protein
MRNGASVILGNIAAGFRASAPTAMMITILISTVRSATTMMMMATIDPAPAGTDGGLTQ